MARTKEIVKSKLGNWEDVNEALRRVAEERTIEKKEMRHGMA